ncbi:endoplasmic reticulum aminopeptidase 1b [Kryptolebias marmoratus]|uniref:Aminopeptidase n=1 Tax=Kryptolebias marmoratus TaxID=37003 RepID=A0A3Q3F515_KRYMA|nr:endoplasmic reticulum aminopeptidase 1b [Kryptolebias marmoratus]XP_017267903.1 endoplasmic reticulum aminopeptidase 1b [Kryptolebias marmoratus]XP_037833332.1 endoplasmic reticulum aminopeptidase 1b [Kryptolebias marmoratus]XP_037833334.1 endoplasmic reticulum aminopeptidase 1b [Kryptolebias marmoratus]
MFPLLLVLSVLCPPSSGAQIPNEGQPSDPPIATNGQRFPWDRMRLPQTVSPLHYDLTIHPNLTTLDFTGVVRISLDVHEDTSVVILHAKQMQVSNVLLLAPGGARPLRVLEYPRFHQLALLSDSVLAKGRKYEVQLEFAANLSDSFHGFYKSSYRTSSGEVRVMASTQFEATFARGAFPCFDEPAFKANFTIRITREPRHIAISNMPKVKTVELPGGLLEDHFDTTVKMSTYLVAYIVSDFLSVSRTTQHGVQISIYSVPEKINQTAFALDAAVKLLDFYDDYFDIPYPLPKQDLAAIPDFQSGAMENWGLTTYRETGLLFDPDKSSASDKLAITKVIAHELAHQWFGNLVTMEWWNDLWLNEGFAKFMEFISLDITYPDLHVDNFFLGKCFEAMEVDSLSSSHPVSTPVENPTQIQEMFDDVSYDKGACILNMLRDFLTPEAFEIGIIRYLKRFSYQNTVNSHLWESLTDICSSDDLDEGRMKHVEFCSKRKLQSGASKWYSGDELDVKAIMDTWTLQEGFPLVTVEVRGREVRLSQERFLRADDLSLTEGYLWQIPLTYQTSVSNTIHRFLLKTKTDVLYLPEEVDWVKFNVNMSGYYMVHYAGEGWGSIINLLHHNHTALSGNDRASLIQNVFQLVGVGKVRLDTALELSLYLSRETEIMAVTQGFGELVPLYKLMEKRDMPELENQMKGYIVDLFRDLINQQEWTDSGSVSQRVLRSYLLLFACVRNYEPCLKKATRLFNQWKDSDGTMSLPVDITMAVFVVGARTPEGWNFLFEKFRSSMQMSVRSRIKTAMTVTPLQDKLEWMMEQSLNGEVMKTQDLPDIVVSVARNPRGYKLAWDFLRANWVTLIKKFDLGSNSVSYMVNGVTNQYSTREMLNEIRSFFDSLTEETGSKMRCIQQTYETIEDNIRWMDTHLPLLEAWLNKRRHRTTHEDL